MREDIKGRLWCRGDYDTWVVRRWIAFDRDPIVPNVTRPSRVCSHGR